MVVNYTYKRVNHRNANKHSDQGQSTMPFSEPVLHFFIEHGYTTFFCASFLAATILPLSSEFLLSLLLLNNYNAFNVVVIGTAGNVLGAIMNYGLGHWGDRLVLQQWLRLSSKEIHHAEKRFKKYGLFSLCFAWVPIIGDPLTVAAGLLKINFYAFLLLVTVGKLLRYVIITLSVQSL